MRPDRLIWELVAVLAFKAAFFWGVWACCFRQDRAPPQQPPFLEEVRHGADR